MIQGLTKGAVCKISKLGVMSMCIKLNALLLSHLQNIIPQNVSARVQKKCTVCPCISNEIAQTSDLTDNLKLYHKYKEEIPEPVPWDSNGLSLVFSHYQIHGSPGAYASCLYYGCG